MPDADPASLLATLKARGLFQQASHEEALARHLATGVRAGYVGFDPTADSLTIGNLVAIMLLVHLQRAGHRPVVVAGGGTGLIGDPSGKSAERQLLSREQVEANVAGQRRIFERLLDFTPALATRAQVVNNADWLARVGYIEMLRDVGKYFSVNVMIQRDAVRDRLENREQGISYTEFSYVLLQSYDFLHLRRTLGVTLQLGGSDQWGNMVSGADLIRRLLPAPDNEAFALTAPLVTKEDGGKFGKTESGAIWLTADRTSPYAFHQFWRNSDDKDVFRFLRLFTLLPLDEIDALAVAHERDPGERAPHRALAAAATDLVHGEAERRNAEAAAAALFSGELAALPEPLLDEVLRTVPASDHDKAQLAGDGLALVDLIAQTTLAKSKREARDLLAGGSITLHGRKATEADRLTARDLLHGRIAAFRRGKKSWHVTRWR